MSLNNLFNVRKKKKLKNSYRFICFYIKSVYLCVAFTIRSYETPIYSLFTKRKIVLFAIAAVFIIALSIPLVNLINVKTAEVDAIILENYLTQQADITDEDIAELLDEENIDHIKIDVKIDNSELEDILISNPDMEEYLN